MGNYSKNKGRLLSGVSTALLFGLGMGMGQASAATVSTGSSTGLSGVDAVLPTDQNNTDDQSASANGTLVESVNNALSGASISIDSNSITAPAIGNTATSSLSDSGAVATSTTAGIVVSQGNAGFASAQTSGTDLTLTAGTTGDSALNISGNTTKSSAVLNTDTTSISDTGMVANSTAAVISTSQLSQGQSLTNISAQAASNGNAIALTAGATDNSSLTIQSNTDSSLATGNSTTQRLTLDGTALTLGTANAEVSSAPITSGGNEFANLGLSGSGLISSAQTNTYTDVSAQTSGSSIALTTLATQGSNLDISNNAQDATAMGSMAANTAAISGTTVGAGIGIGSQQTSGSGSDVTAATTASASISTGALATDNTDQGASVSLTDNKIQSRAVSGSVSNTLSVAATTATVGALASNGGTTITSDSSSTADSSTTGTVVAGYATVNDQLISGKTTAQTTADGGAAFDIATGAAANGTAINNDSNTLGAQAQAALATNSTVLNIGGTLSAGTGTGYANVAGIANVQDVQGDVLAQVAGGNVASTYVGGALTDSSVSTSSNKAQALAEGATATNSLIASATTMGVAASGTAEPGSVINGDVGVDSAFAVANSQKTGNIAIAAELSNSITANTQVTGNTNGSSISSTGNGQDAFATANKATNSVSLSATTLDGDAAVANYQSSMSQVSSLIGGSYNGDGDLVVGLDGANAGAVVTLGGELNDSAVAVTGNSVRGSAINNVATNSLTVSATTLNGGGSGDLGYASSGSVTTTADYSLGNAQVLDDTAAATTNVYATYGVSQALGKDVSGSSIAVSNNTQFGEALGNSAVNRLTMASTSSGSGIDPTAALNNAQSGDNATTLDSTSEMTFYANIASSGSSVALNGNSNTALAVENNASNTLTATSNALNGSGVAAASVDGSSTTASFALFNNQSAAGTLNSTALTTGSNVDQTNDGTSGVLNGSVSMSKNTTTSEASANRVANTLSVSGTSNAATAGIGNDQYATATVTATASQTSYQLDLTGDAAVADYAASGSRLAVEGNTTTALARGNSASNVLNYTVGVSYDGGSASPSYGSSSAGNAAAAVLNMQDNLGNVTANASNVTYAVALNQGSVGAAYNSAATVGGNVVNAIAYGNTANNSIAMSTFGAGIPASAVNSVQSNSGSIVATANGASFSVSPSGGTEGSALRNSGNVVNAQAVGNSSVSTIGGM